MKTIKVFITIFLAVVALCSCNKSDYLSVVPSDATFVASANLAALAEKGDFSNSSISSSVDAYLPLVFSGESKNKMKGYLESPKEMGIDFREPVYIFKTVNQCVGMTMKMLDKGDFENFIKVLQNQNLATKPVERDDIMTGTFLDDVDYAYDGKTILLLASVGEGGSAIGKQTLVKLFKQDKDDSFVNTEEYEQLSAKSDCDISIFSNMAALPQDLAVQFKSLIPNGVRFTDVELIASVDFKNGKAVLTSELMGTNDKAKKMLKEGDDNFHKIEGRYVDMPTSDFLMWGCMGVNGEWLLDKLKQDNDMKQRLFLVERGIDIEAMIKSIDGDMAITLPKSFYTDEEASSTNFMACGQLKSSKFLDDVDYWKQGMKEYGLNMQSIGKNEYLLSSSDFKMCWGVNDDDLFIGSQSAYQEMANSQKSTLISSNKDEIKKCQAYVYVNLKELPLMQIAEMSGVPFLKKAASKLNAIVYKCKSSSQMELSIELTDDKENFLKEIL